jgi:hypothetical protein
MPYFIHPSFSLQRAAQKPLIFGLRSLRYNRKLQPVRVGLDYDASRRYVAFIELVSFDDEAADFWKAHWCVGDVHASGSLYFYYEKACCGC